ncbi:metal ABC transporter ATP-binding protein [Candidatus Woesearchaeota archaeon]|nr:metal ABC transporter ATP-binding protein [Candidatus Woesearchaeota archaeon]
MAKHKRSAAKEQSKLQEDAESGLRVDDGGTGGVGEASGGSIVSVENLSFSYGSGLVLDDVTFSISRDDFVGLIGPNGSGKSTLVKLLMGLNKPDSGRISLFGKDIGSFNDWGKIAYVPQKASQVDPLFPITVREVVEMGLLSKKRFPKILISEDKFKVDKALKIVGMEGFSGRRIGELSGGQQQRVFIARAVVSSPQLLVLDEPTVGVDQATQVKFYELLGNLNRAGIAIILISHDIGMITRFVTKVAVLSGKLVFYGTHKQFCSSDQVLGVLAKHHHLLDLGCNYEKHKR